ncbi:hypothetical protein HK405_014694 [Cladochytrium tenue]|nr:hypothetical protein HK405_014694 [Cladochytrium tenue]
MTTTAFSSLPATAPPAAHPFRFAGILHHGGLGTLQTWLDAAAPSDSQQQQQPQNHRVPPRQAVLPVLFDQHRWARRLQLRLPHLVRRFDAWPVPTPGGTGSEANDGADANIDGAQPPPPAIDRNAVAAAVGWLVDSCDGGSSSRTALATPQPPPPALVSPAAALDAALSFVEARLVAPALSSRRPAAVAARPSV